MIKAVLLDYGGVLSTGGASGSVQMTIAKYYGIEFGAVKLDPIHGQLRKGLITTEDFFQELARRHSSQTPMTEEAWLSNYVSILKPSEKVYRLAERIREQGIKTGILSNIFAMTANALRQDGAYDGFEPVILSYEVKMAKPEPEIYGLAAQRTGVKPQEILFIDDQERCLLPAQKIGMKTVLANSPGQIINDVSKILQEENGIKLKILD